MVRNQYDGRQCFIADDTRFWNSGKDLIHNSVCKDLPVEHHYDGNWYCVLHYPDSKKHETTNFLYVLSERLQNEVIDFSYVHFSFVFSLFGRKCAKPARFWSAVFMDQANFDNITFDAEVDFRFSIFHKEASFNRATFQKEAIFPSTIFKRRISFHSTIFSDSADFDRATFEADSNFSSAYFNKHVNFRNAVFNDDGWFSATNFLGHADFNYITFDKMAVFSSAIFKSKAYFYSTIFKGKGEFSGVTFDDDALFNGATFDEDSQIIFTQATFKKTANFNRSIFRGYVYFDSFRRRLVFSEPDSLLDLQEARLEKPERVSFKNVRLRPNWFINVDSRKFIFHDVDWENGDGISNETVLELEALRARKITERPYKLLTIACRQLAVNFEENNHYEQASGFRRMAMELAFRAKLLSLLLWLKQPFNILYLFVRTKLKRKNTWHRLYSYHKSQNKKPFSFRRSFVLPHFLYRTFSSYGEGWARALGMLLILLLVFTIIFTQTNFQTCPKDRPMAMSLATCESLQENENSKECNCQTGGLNFWEASRHSLATASLQTVEYRRPITGWGELWVILEKILVPLQFALLALTLRRKFMR